MEPALAMGAARASLLPGSTGRRTGRPRAPARRPGSGAGRGPARARGRGGGLGASTAPARCVRRARARAPARSGAGSRPNDPWPVPVTAASPGCLPSRRRGGTARAASDSRPGPLRLASMPVSRRAAAASARARVSLGRRGPGEPCDELLAQTRRRPGRRSRPCRGPRPRGYRGPRSRRARRPRPGHR